MALLRPVPAIALPGAVALALLSHGGGATAHPHVWITDVTTFVFEGRELVALRHHWQFDEIFSSFVIEEHDANGDGRFDAAETTWQIAICRPISRPRPIRASRARK